jgi:inner membrane protein
MDLLTHAAVGAVAAAAIAPTATLRRAALTGALAGLSPDLDALIQSAGDPLLNLEYHRHFTHALILVPFGALVPATLVWLLLRRRAPLGPLYAYAFIGYLLAPLLDACTSYGTHLLWPFAEHPIAFAIISIVDPVFTLVVVVPLSFALLRRRPAIARGALAAAALILAIGAIQHERALAEARNLAASRGHAMERVLVKPSFANMLLWRSLYLAEGRIHVDAIRVGAPGNIRIYPGASAPRFEPEKSLAIRRDSILAGDIRRFQAFTDGLPVRHPQRADFIGDARFSMLPTSLVPLWGIVIDASAPDRHVRFETDRSLTPAMRRRFLEMLLGRDPT